jgi:Rieske Fe-S protein
VLAGAAILGILPLSACGGTTDQNDPDANSAKGGPEQGPRTPEPGQGGRGILAQVTDIPVGGGKVFDTRRVVVTQPTPGNFKGFNAVCTHMGCLVATVQNGVIHCPCHGSEFSITDGSVRGGPATKPLPPREITVDTDQIRLLD